MQKIKIFLDSSDYSNFANPKLRDQYGEVYETLLKYVGEGLVECYYSVSMLSEISPVKEIHAAWSKDRAEILARLCGSNALIFINDLFKKELAAAHGVSSEITSVHSNEGKWYPFDIINSCANDFLDLKIQAVGGPNPNRLQRRLAKRQLKSKSQIVKIVTALEEFGIKPTHRAKITEFISGEGELSDVKDAIAASFSDPTWMMNWFSRHSGEESFADCFRSPARNVAASFAPLVDLSYSMIELDKTHQTNLADQVVSAAAWRKQQENALVKVANGIGPELLGEGFPELSLERIREACPGLACAIYSMISSARESMAQKAMKNDPRKPPEPNDFLDAIHAAYAPYVDIFRADGFMANHIKRSLDSEKTVVVPKLTQLIPAINAARKAAEGQ